MNFCCQGHVFLLSGEEFARTKNGIRDTYKTPLEINRLDWTRAWKNRTLADYYRGLIALRLQCPGLQDKTPLAAGRIDYFGEPRPGCAAYFVDNTGGPWKRLCLIYNTSREDVTLRLPAGNWTQLVSGEDSFLWKTQQKTGETLAVKACSAAILGEI